MPIAQKKKSVGRDGKKKVSLNTSSVLSMLDKKIVDLECRDLKKRGNLNSKLRQQNLAVPRARCQARRRPLRRNVSEPAYFRRRASDIFHRNACLPPYSFPSEEEFNPRGTKTEYKRSSDLAGLKCGSLNVTDIRKYPSDIHVPAYSASSRGIHWGDREKLYGAYGRVHRNALNNYAWEGGQSCFEEGQKNTYNYNTHRSEYATPAASKENVRFENLLKKYNNHKGTSSWKSGFTKVDLNKAPLRDSSVKWRESLNRSFSSPRPGGSSVTWANGERRDYGVRFMTPNTGCTDTNFSKFNPDALSSFNENRYDSEKMRSQSLTKSSMLYTPSMSMFVDDMKLIGNEKYASSVYPQKYTTLYEQRATKSGSFYNNYNNDFSKYGNICDSDAFTDTAWTGSRIKSNPTLSYSSLPSSSFKALDLGYISTGFNTERYIPRCLDSHAPSVKSNSFGCRYNTGYVPSSSKTEFYSANHPYYSTYGSSMPVSVASKPRVDLNSTLKEAMSRLRRIDTIINESTARASSSS